MGFHTEVVTPPGIEPITKAEGKAQLRITFPNDDALVDDLIGTAREMVETEASRSFITRQSDLFLDYFPGGAPLYGILRELQRGFQQRPPDITDGIFIPNPPLISIDAITYQDPSGNVLTLDPAAYRVSTGTPGRITPTYGLPWPVTRPVADCIRIRYTSGYGTAATAVPTCVKAAIKLLVAHLYYNRTDPVIPDAIKRVLSPVAWGRYR